MSKASGRKVLISFILVLLLALAGGTAYYRYLKNRFQLPELSVSDINEKKVAATVERENGTTFSRTALPTDSQGVQLSGGPDGTGRDPAGQAGWTQLHSGHEVHLGTLIHVNPASTAQLMASGNWIVGMDGEGEYVFEDARTNPTSTIHSSHWYVKRGNFRARPYDYDPSDHWMMIRTPTARILVHQGEIGLKLNEVGGGQLWLMSGKAKVFYNDGRQRDVVFKGMDFL